MAKKPEEKARDLIDRQLTQCGWIVQDREAMNITAGRGVALDDEGAEFTAMAWAAGARRPEVIACAWRRYRAFCADLTEIFEEEEE